MAVGYIIIPSNFLVYTGFRNVGFNILEFNISFKSLSCKNSISCDSSKSDISLTISFCMSPLKF